MGGVRISQNGGKIREKITVGGMYSGSFNRTRGEKTAKSGALKGNREAGRPGQKNKKEKKSEGGGMLKDGGGASGNFKNNHTTKEREKMGGVEPRQGYVSKDLGKRGLTQNKRWGGKREKKSKGNCKVLQART